MPRNVAGCAVWAGVGLALVAAVVWLTASGSPEGFSTVGALLRAWYTGGVAGPVWLAGAAGIGLWIWRRLTRISGTPDPGTAPAVAPAIGVALALWLSHLIGLFGVLRGPLGLVIAWVIPVLGAAAWVSIWRHHKQRPAQPAARLGSSTSRWEVPVVALASVPALAVLFIAAVVPAGMIWSTEANGYDALSYHLPLPREWVDRGRIEPLRHNAYSWLPSAMEASFAQINVMLGGGVGAPPSPATRDWGRWILASQALHAGCAVIAAIGVAGLVRQCAARTTPVSGGKAGRQRDDAAATLSACLAGAAVLATPWTSVTGSLAYNELGLLTCFAGALAAAGTQRAGERPWIFGALCGFMLGMAGACKPTAAFMCGPAVLLAIISWVPDRSRMKFFGASLLGGSLASAPWLIRNEWYGGNPVFPYMTRILGIAHWDEGQVDRWMAEHNPPADLAANAARLFSDVGAMHPQWSAFFVVAAAALVVLAGVPSARRACWPLMVALLGQALVWAMVGHQMPRFLVPLLVPGAVLIGLAARVFYADGWVRSVTAASAVVVGVLSLSTAWNFRAQHRGTPTIGLSLGIDGITGAALGPDDGLLALPEWERTRIFETAGNPVAATNRLVGLEAAAASRGGAPLPRVYLLGQATPIYYTVPILWNVTWDRWPLDDAMQAHPDDPAAWGPFLKARGVTHVQLSYSEVDRLNKSGYTPPGITVESCARFIRACGDPIIEWKQLGVGLYRLK